MTQERSNNSYSKFIFQMLTALICGTIIAFLGIEVIRYNNQDVKKVPKSASVEQNADVNVSLLEEGEVDPSFVSRFSRVFIYSSDNGKEIIQSAKNSLPKTSNLKISASAYAVIDLDRNALLIEKNSEQLLPIASVTKLVTAVVAKKLLNEDLYVTMSDKILSTYGNEAKFRIGEKLRVSELFYPLLMVSSNDSSEALAQSYSKGRINFMKEMNNWVNSIGAYRTYFADPSGLSVKNVSTTKDLSIIVKWILVNEPEIFDITLLKSKTTRTHTWINPTHFLNLTSYAGGKNGYTPEANRTSVALFKLGKQNRLYGVILLDSAARDSDILDLLEEAIR